jgi:hypothetical protein
MSFTIPRRTAAVTALAVAAFSGVALVSAATASAGFRANTSLSIRIAHGAINPGGGDAITGFLQSPAGHVAGHKVELLAKPQGTPTWTKAMVHRTGVHGGYGFQVTPTVSTRYVVTFLGNKQQKPSRSAVGLVRVLDTTSLTISLGTTSIDPGDSDTVNGVLSLDGTPLVGDTVNLLGKSGNHSFSKLGSAMTAADGSVSFTVTPVVTTHYMLRFNKTEADNGARSAIATVHVLRPSSLSIRARTNKKTGDEVISGDLRGGGQGLAHRKVTLMDRPDGTTTWTAVASSRTSHNGGVGFSEPAPTSSEDYELVFAGGPIFEGCQSGIVTVTVS